MSAGLAERICAQDAKRTTAFLREAAFALSARLGASRETLVSI